MAGSVAGGRPVYAYLVDHVPGADRAHGDAGGLVEPGEHGCVGLRVSERECGILGYDARRPC